MGWELVAESGSVTALRPGVLRVGSAATAEITLLAPGVEPEHLTLTVTEQRLLCRAVGAMFLHNGRPVQRSELCGGDQLSLGSAMFTVRRLEPTPAEVVRHRRQQATLDSQFEQLRHSTVDHDLRGQLDVLYRLARLAGSATDPASLGQGLLELVLGAVQGTRAFFVSFDSPTEHRVIAARPQGVEAAPSHTILSRVQQQGVSLITSDAAHDPRLDRSHSIVAGAVRMALCAPVWSGDELLGALYVDGQEQAPGTSLSDDLTLLESIASYAGVALGRARLYQSLQQRELHTHLLVHDMKSPLSGMVGGLDLLAMQAQELQGGQQLSETLELIQRSTGELEGFITDILNVAQLEQGVTSLRREPVELDGLLQQLTLRWEASCRFTGRCLSTALDPADSNYSLDRRLISRVLDNLVGNALRHTPRGSKVDVSAVVDHGLYVTIRDEGPGVPLEARQRIFDKFGRVEAGQVGGSGFGLYFCRLVLAAHGGEIWVEGDPGDNRFVLQI